MTRSIERESEKIGGKNKNERMIEEQYDKTARLKWRGEKS